MSKQPFSRRSFLSAAGLSAGTLGLAACNTLVTPNGMSVAQPTAAAQAAAPPVPARPLDVPHVAYDPAAVPSPISRVTPTTVEYTLVAKELTAEIADGVSYRFWTFNGTVPGPLLRVMEGDTVKVTVENASDSEMPHPYVLSYPWTERNRKPVANQGGRRIDQWPPSVPSRR